jgi:O-antigen biosynthesis protein
VMVGWDNTPRLQNNGQIFVNSHPANYGRWLSAIVEQTRRTREPEERIVFVNAWNEWGEGCHLEPDQAFGRAYLQATRDALARATVTAGVR